MDGSGGLHREVFAARAHAESVAEELSAALKEDWEVRRVIAPSPEDTRETCGVTVSRPSEPKESLRRLVDRAWDTWEERFGSAEAG